jgi:5,10-methylenetetrahydrofolate reductase
LKIHYELDPSTKKEKIVDQVRFLHGLVDKINVPDNPMGYIKASSLAVSIFLKQIGFEPVMHIRAIDRTMLAIKSEVYGAKLFNINEILLVKGDIPSKENFEVFNNNRLERIVEYLKEDEKIKDIKIGLPLTNFSKISDFSLSRLNSKADFIVTTQIRNAREINEELIKVIRRNNKELHCYYILVTDKNKDFIYNFGLVKEDKVPSLEEYLNYIEELETVVDALILSSPLDLEFLTILLNKYRRK